MAVRSKRVRSTRIMIRGRARGSYTVAIPHLAGAGARATQSTAEGYLDSAAGNLQKELG